MSQVLHLLEIQIDLGILYFHLLNLATLRLRPVLVASPFYPQRSEAWVTCMGDGCTGIACPIPSPGPPLTQLPPPRANC